MYIINLALVLAFWILNFALSANAGIYVLNPASGTKCRAGQLCDIDWLDDGVRPLLSAAGVCTFGLYTGKQKLVQAIPPADVFTTHSISFKPNPAAGPNSNAYYIGIISTTFKDNSSSPYAAFSPFFSIDQMTGSFDNPLPEATSTFPIPSSLTRFTGTATSRPTTKLSTITVGTLLTSQAPLPTFPSLTSKSSVPASSSPSSASLTKLLTSVLPSTPITAGTGTSAPASTPLSNNAVRHSSSISEMRAVLLIISLLSLSTLFF